MSALSRNSFSRRCFATFKTKSKASDDGNVKILFTFFSLCSTVGELRHSFTQWCASTHNCAGGARAGDVRSHLLHLVFLLGDELQSSLEGSFDEQAHLPVNELGRRLAVGLLRQERRRLKGQLTHRLVHSELDDLTTQRSRDDFTRLCAPSNEKPR